MRKKRVISAAILICALSTLVWAISAGATEARPEWVRKVGAEEKLLKSGESEALSQSITTIKNWMFKQSTGAGIAVECNSTKFSSGFKESLLTGPRGINFGPLLFEGCKVTAPAGDTSCEVRSSGFPNGQLRTQALGFLAEEGLEGSTKKPRVRIRPESTREEIVTIELSGGTCTHPGSYEVQGLLVGNMDSSALSKSHKWEFTQNTGTRLTIGEVEATFSGTGSFTLKSGNEWGAK
jgi:hypothetical protein